jgi:uncharacterized protein YndB with AHSA1/START domain
MPMKNTTNTTTVERASDRELVVTRTVNGPARIVFEAFTRPELFKRWWVPKSFGLSLLSCELDVRVGGTYRLVFSHSGSEPVAFFGRYVEVTPQSRLVWTNDEGGGDGAVTTVTFEEKDGRTLVVTSIRRRKLSTPPSPPGAQVGLAKRSNNWTSFWSRSARGWDGHEVAGKTRRLLPLSC